MTRCDRALVDLERCRQHLDGLSGGPDVAVARDTALRDCRVLHRHVARRRATLVADGVA